MKITEHCVAMIAVTLVAGCAMQPVRTDRLDRVAIITSGSTNIGAVARFRPVVSVVEIDGKPVAKPYGPIELAPGPHSVTMKCGDSTKTSSVTVAAGEVYEFAFATTPAVKGCVGSLSRVRSADRPVTKVAVEDAQAARARSEFDEAVKRAKEERAKSALAKSEAAARLERAKSERTEAGSLLTPDQRAVSEALASWAAAWSNKDVKGYLAAYAKDFAVPRGRSRRQWEAERRARIVGKSWIEVKIEALEISVDGNVARARFRQDYRSNKLTESSVKTLTLVKTNEQWLIQQER
ncbi:MAG: nuclear transport factor 2 family protein [Pseudomonadota bacterium]